eukprot:764106-Hanusia_phi.AAC.1
MVQVSGGELLLQLIRRQEYKARKRIRKDMVVGAASHALPCLHVDAFCRARTSSHVDADFQEGLQHERDRNSRDALYKSTSANNGIRETDTQRSLISAHISSRSGSLDIGERWSRCWSVIGERGRGIAHDKLLALRTICVKFDVKPAIGHPIRGNFCFPFGGHKLFVCILADMKQSVVIAFQVREKITLWCHEKYMRKVRKEIFVLVRSNAKDLDGTPQDDMIFYKANKVGDDKIEHCDHQITSDVDKFSEMFSQVLSQSLKPIVDFIVYSVDLR